MRLHLTSNWRQRLVGSVSPGTPVALINFFVWLAILAIVLFMAVSSAG